MYDHEQVKMQIEAESQAMHRAEGLGAGVPVTVWKKWEPARGGSVWYVRTAEEGQPEGAEHVSTIVYNPEDDS